jgi:hypothetical protein
MPAFTLCADFTLFPVTSPPTQLPSHFILAGFTFQQLGGPSGPWSVNSLNGCQGLQLAAAGPTPQEVQITLPVPVSTVSLGIGNFGQAVDIAALDSSGNTVKKMTIPHLNNCVNTSIQAPEISSLVLTSQDFESILERICEAICCP